MSDENGKEESNLRLALHVALAIVAGWVFLCGFLVMGG